MAWDLILGDAMPIDLPPPEIATTIFHPATEIAAQEPYGPPDTGQPEQRHDDEVRQLTPDCPQSSENEIVVCAPTDPGQHRLGDLPPPGQTSWNILDAATTIKLGPAEFQPHVMDGDSSSPIPAKGVGIEMRIRF